MNKCQPITRVWRQQAYVIKDCASYKIDDIDKLKDCGYLRYKMKNKNKALCHYYLHLQN